MPWLPPILRVAVSVGQCQPLESTLPRAAAEAAAAAAAAASEVLSSAILAVKRTFRPSVIRKKRTHGFLHRNASTGGRQLLKRRRRIGRKTLCP